MEMQKTDSKVYVESQKAQNSQTILREKKQVGGMILPNVKAYY